MCVKPTNSIPGNTETSSFSSRQPNHPPIFQPHPNLAHHLIPRVRHPRSTPVSRVRRSRQPTPTFTRAHHRALHVDRVPETDITPPARPERLERINHTDDEIQHHNRVDVCGGAEAVGGTVRRDGGRLRIVQQHQLRLRQRDQRVVDDAREDVLDGRQVRGLKVAVEGIVRDGGAHIIDVVDHGVADRVDVQGRRKGLGDVVDGLHDAGGIGVRDAVVVQEVRSRGLRGDVDGLVDDVDTNREIRGREGDGALRLVQTHVLRPRGCHAEHVAVVDGVGVDGDDGLAGGKGGRDVVVDVVGFIGEGANDLENFEEPAVGLASGRGELPVRGLVVDAFSVGEEAGFRVGVESSTLGGERFV